MLSWHNVFTSFSVEDHIDLCFFHFLLSSHQYCTNLCLLLSAISIVMFDVISLSHGSLFDCTNLCLCVVVLYYYSDLYFFVLYDYFDVYVYLVVLYNYSDLCLYLVVL